MNMLCPYCDKEVDTPDDSSHPETPYENECPHCGKSFIFYVEYDPSFNTNKAPCLNGGEHDFQPIIGWPKEFFLNKFRCSYCAIEKYTREVPAGEPAASSA